MHACRLFAVVACLLVAVTPAACSAVRQPIPPVPPVTPALLQAAAHENAFAFELLRSVDRDASTGNTFLSPLSIDQAVSMLAAGAGGQTLAEIDRTLHTGGTAAPDALSQAAALRQRLLAQGEQPQSSFELTIANALWADRATTLRPAFVEACHRQLGAKATNLDFQQPSAADTINQWVSTNTRGKIDTIVNQQVLSDASAVLTDAVYFHGRWDDPFDSSLTKDAPFHTASGAQKPLPLMTRIGSFLATQTGSLQAITLPYGHSGMSMIVVLPRAGHSLDALAQSLTPATWNQLTASLRDSHVTLFLPRFHIDDSHELARNLDTLGMRRVFTPAADLSPMSNASLYVTGVIHKTTLDVDEKGTVATAATAIIMEQASVEIPAQQFTMRVDHPFLCAIRDDATGALLFLGCVRDPQAIH